MRRQSRRLLLASALLGAVACVPTDRGWRYGGVVAPCEVRRVMGDGEDVRRREAGVEAARGMRFEEPGPYFTWNTAPTSECEQNPVTGAQTDKPGVPFYVTYPATDQPTLTGEAQAAAGPFPVIVFAHANHDLRCEVFQGYFTLHDHWASWGYVVASVDSTDLNCQRGSRDNIRDRAAEQLAVLAELEAMHADPQSPLFGRLDLGRVVLAGHSRGGGASKLNATALREAGEPAAALIDLQGVEMTSYGFGRHPIETPTLGITAGRDVDLNFPYVDPAEESLEGEYTWVTIFGGIHAWTADTSPSEPDDRPTISPAEQRRTTRLFTTAHLAHHVGAPRAGEPPPWRPRDASRLLFSHGGARAALARTSTAGVALRWRQDHPGEVLIDSFLERGRPETNALGHPYTFVGFTSAEVTSAYAPEAEVAPAVFDKARALWLSATQWPGLVITELAPPGEALELPEGARLQARLRGRTGWFHPEKMEVVLSFEDGSERRYDAAEHWGPVGVTNRYVQLDVPLELGPEGARVTRLALLLERGTILLDDLRFVLPGAP